MTPEQTSFFMQALERLLIAASEGVEVDGEIIKLRAAEFMTGVRLLWMGKESSGYVNFSHDEGMLLCNTEVNSTMRYHLIRLRKAGVLTKYSTNGTVRAQTNYYPDSQNLVIHERNSRGVSTNSRGVSTPDDESSESREHTARSRAVYQLLRAAGSRDRAAGQQYSRSSADYPQSSPPVLVVSSNILTNPPQGEVTNLLTQANDEKPNAIEQTISYLLLIDSEVNLDTETAKLISSTLPLEQVRAMVWHWYTNRKSVEDRKVRNGFDETPGILKTWFQQPQKFRIPSVNHAFYNSDFYLHHRTKAEVEADRRSEEEETARAATWEALENEIDTVATPSLCEEPTLELAIDADDIWRQTLERIRRSGMVALIFESYFAGTSATFGGEITINCTNRTQMEQLKSRYAGMIKRNLSSVLERNIHTIQFEVSA